jgi:hypothetical protein
LVVRWAPWLTVSHRSLAAQYGVATIRPVGEPPEQAGRRGSMLSRQPLVPSAAPLVAASATVGPQVEWGRWVGREADALDVLAAPSRFSARRLDVPTSRAKRDRTGISDSAARSPLTGTDNLPSWMAPQGKRGDGRPTTRHSANSSHAGSVCRGVGRRAAWGGRGWLKIRARYRRARGFLCRSAYVTGYQ